jgi:hypothetical protein
MTSAELSRLPQHMRYAAASRLRFPYWQEKLITVLHCRLVLLFWRLSPEPKPASEKNVSHRGSPP